MLEGYLGRLGAGKTYNMVKDVLPYIGKLPIYSNMHLDWAIYFDTWDDVCGITNGILMIDELGLWAMSREYTKFPKEVLRHVINSRKNGLHIKWTAQSEGGVDVSFRRQTAIYYRHIRYANFINVQVEDATSGEKMYKRWVLLQKKVFDRYDTYEIVGDGSGGAGSRGAAGTDKETREVKELLRTAFVRVQEPPIPGSLYPEPVRWSYRRATQEDLARGASVCSLQNGVLVPVDTSRFALSALHSLVAPDPPLPAALFVTDPALATRGFDEVKDRAPVAAAPYRPRYGRKALQDG